MDKQLVAKNITKGTWRSMVVATARFEREIISRGVENYGTMASISNFADTSVSIAFAVPFTDHAIQTFQYLSRINFYCTFVPIESPCKLNARSLEEATN